MDRYGEEIRRDTEIRGVGRTESERTSRRFGQSVRVVRDASAPCGCRKHTEHIRPDAVRRPSTRFAIVSCGAEIIEHRREDWKVLYEWQRFLADSYLE